MVASLSFPAVGIFRRLVSYRMNENIFDKLKISFAKVAAVEYKICIG